MWNGTMGALTTLGMSKRTEDREASGSQGTHVFDGVKEDGAANDIVVPLSQDWYAANGGGFGNIGEQFIQDASYYRLRYISLSWKLNKKWLENIPFKDISLSFTGRNLLLFTPYEGVDPETSLAGADSNAQGLDYFNNPSTKSVSFGLKLKF